MPRSLGFCKALSSFCVCVCDSNVKTTKVRLLLCTLSTCRLFDPCKVSTWWTLRGQTEWDMWTQCLDGTGSLCPGRSSKFGTVPPVLSVGSRACGELPFSYTYIFSWKSSCASHGSPGMCLQFGLLRTHHPDWQIKQLSSWLQIYKEYWSLYKNYINVYLYGGTAEYSLNWQFLKLRFCNYVLC